MYKCADCGHRFEDQQGFHDDPHDTCPDCGGQVRRVIGNVGVTFKGSGFYRTDSRSDKKKASTPAKTQTNTESSAPTKTESSAPAKAESKPAAKDSGSSSKGSSTN
jgi:putative FmdB family regulatory protein